MRHYIKDGKEYQSVTSLLEKIFPFNKEAFERWCQQQGYNPDDIRTLSSSIGSKVSSWINNKTRGVLYLDPPTVGVAEEGLYRGVQDFTDTYKVLESEITVFCDEFMYAGTLDGIVNYKDKEYLMDWKTYGAWKGNYKRDPKRIKEVSYQLSMYRYALGKELPIAVVVFKTDGTYEVEELAYTEDWIDKLFKEKEDGHTKTTQKRE